MKVKPKNFICENCSNETYADSEKCRKCNEENTIKPIPKDIYRKSARKPLTLYMGSIRLEDLLKILYKGQWIIVGTPNARCYEGYLEDFDIEKLLTEKVLFVNVIGDRSLYITVGDWNK